MKSEDITLLRKFMPAMELNTILANCVGEEGEFFRAKIEEMANLVTNMPKTYEQDGKGDEAIAYLHYFAGACDWWITERDMEVVQYQAFGFANLGDPEMAELGYISIVELIQNGVELDLYFQPCKLAQIRLRMLSY